MPVLCVGYEVMHKAPIQPAVTDFLLISWDCTQFCAWHLVNFPTERKTLIHSCWWKKWLPKEIPKYFYYYLHLSRAHRSPGETCHLLKPCFLNFSTIDIWGLIIPSCGASHTLRDIQQHPGPYWLDAHTSIPRPCLDNQNIFRHLQMPPGWQN